MKTLEFSGKKVKDVSGLYYELLKEHFEVENVGVGGDCTYVYLGDDEDKDPALLVAAWAEKPAMPTTKGAIEERRRMAVLIVAKAREERAAKAAARTALKAREEDLGVEDIFLLPPPESEGAPKVAAPRKESFFSKIFKVFRS
jgi:hypothetical protein